MQNLYAIWDQMASRNLRRQRVWQKNAPPSTTYRPPSHLPIIAGGMGNFSHTSPHGPVPTKVEFALKTINNEQYG